MMESKKIAIYGGSFNPPTQSHFQILKMVMEEIKVDGCNLDEIWMVP
jgi:nicotinic acid mononucleotide adenylyltransferase